MAVIRVKKDKNYTVMANYHLRDLRLSNKAIGLMSKMLSLPDDWDYTVAGLAAICKDGRDGIFAQLKELEEAGYLKRERARNEKGQVKDTVYTLSEKPMTEFPAQEKPTQEKPAQGNPTQLNTDISSTDLINHIPTEYVPKEIKSGKPDHAQEREEIIGYLNEKSGKAYRPNSDKTKKLISARLNEGFTVQDFKTVIDNKVSSWFGNKDMEKFLRPETLFGTKFEGYLNEKSFKQQMQSDSGAGSTTLYI
jgi:uncharacterized phage protein (TIGR02220 family)